MDRAKKAFLKNRRKASKSSTSAPSYNEALSSDSDFVTTPTSSQSGTRNATDADFPEVEGGGDGATGFEDDFTSFGSDEPEAGSSDEDTPNTQDKDGSDEEDDNEIKPLQRQATTEAVERRPLDEGSNSSDEDESSDSDGTAPAASQEPPKSSPLSPEQANEAKKREQAKLMQKWGLDDDDDDDSDDEPIQMGSKYLSRRRTGS